MRQEVLVDGQPTGIILNADGSITVPCGGETNPIKYDYQRQCWVCLVSGMWEVERCGHLSTVAGCYACRHHGDVVEEGAA